MTSGRREGRGGRVELGVVGALLGAILAITFVTYARIEPAELYNVSRDGIAGGLGRVLWESNFPDAIIAVPVALIAVDVLGAAWATTTALVAIPLCLVSAWPGVVDQADVDARPVNLVPACGVLLAILLAGVAARRLSSSRPRLAGDRLRLGLAILIGIGTIPYLFAELGLYAPDPLLADEPTPWQPIAAVHLGSHEGMDGALIALSMLALSRLTPWFTSRRLAAATSTIMAVLIAYGIANLIQDDWLEQVVKRGWTDHRVPSVVHPQLSLAWAAIAAVGICIELTWFRRERRDATDQPARGLEASTTPA